MISAVCHAGNDLDNSDVCNGFKNESGCKARNLSLSFFLNFFSVSLSCLSVPEPARLGALDMADGESRAGPDQPIP